MFRTLTAFPDNCGALCEKLLYGASIALILPRQSMRSRLGNNSDCPYTRGVKGEDRREEERGEKRTEKLRAEYKRILFLLKYLKKKKKKKKKKIPAREVKVEEMREEERGEENREVALEYALG